jgi:hypothetical protein
MAFEEGRAGNQNLLLAVRNGSCPSNFSAIWRLYGLEPVFRISYGRLHTHGLSLGYRDPGLSQG